MEKRAIQKHKESDVFYFQCMFWFISLFLILTANTSKAYNYEFTNIKNCKTYDIEIERELLLIDDYEDFDNKYCKYRQNDLKQKNKDLKSKITEYEEYDEKSVEEYKNKIYNLAKKDGISYATRRDFKKFVEYKADIKKFDNTQPENIKTLDEYLFEQLSDVNLDILHKNILEKRNNKNLNDIEDIFKVEKSIMMALWMHETKFGRIMGKRKIIDALFTLAYNGNRKEFFEKNLIYFLKIVDLKHANINAKGSWAGAFGQIQFMPQTFMKYAINYDDKDSIDIFKNDDDIAASLANYLQNIGWKYKSGIITEVILPNKFDYCLVGFMKNKEKTIQEWKRLGLKLSKNTIGREFFQDTYKKAWLIIPDKTHILTTGCKPRAFLVYENFGHILEWNRSMFFAITIANLQQKSETFEINNQ